MATIHNRPLDYFREKENFSIFVRRGIGTFDVKVYVTERRGNTISLWTHGKDGEILVKDVKEGEDQSDLYLLKLPGQIWDLFADGVAETVPPNKPDVIEAELSATKRHLEDMRKIVSKKLEVEL